MSNERIVKITEYVYLNEGLQLVIATDNNGNNIVLYDSKSTNESMVLGNILNNSFLEGAIFKGFAYREYDNEDDFNKIYNYYSNFNKR